MFSFNRMKQLFRRNNKHPFHFRSDDGGEIQTSLKRQVLNTILAAGSYFEIQLPDTTGYASIRL